MHVKQLCTSTKSPRSCDDKRCLVFKSKMSLKDGEGHLGVYQSKPTDCFIGIGTLQLLNISNLHFLSGNERVWVRILKMLHVFQMQRLHMSVLKL